MVNTDSNRTPTFTLFGNHDFFFTTSDPSFGSPNQCAASTSARCRASPGTTATCRRRSGTPGPGSSAPESRIAGSTRETWTDHTNLRPTILALTGLKDDYQHDGRVLAEALTTGATPAALRSPITTQLGRIYEQLNAPFGQFGQDTLAASTRAVASGSATDDSEYTHTEAAIASLTAKRDALARKIATQLDAAAFAHQPVPPLQAILEYAEASLLIARAHAL